MKEVLNDWKIAVKTPAVRIFILAFVLVFLTIIFLRRTYVVDIDSFWRDVLVEATGFLLDLFLFGIVLTAYDKIRVRKNEIKRHHEEIAAYRGWNEPAAMYRNVASIRRLNDLGVHKMRLMYCYLREARLYRANLSESILRKVDLEGAKLWEVNLTGADLRYANFTGVSFDQTILLDAKVETEAWIDLLASSKTRKFHQVEKQYYVDPAEHKDEIGKPYFLIKEKPKKVKEVVDE